ncbi:MAG: CvpA family protein [bacterium]|nr:CvpA family protein [bacterium]
MSLNWLDIVLIIIVGASVVEGISKGFARVGIGFAAALVGVVLGIWLYGTVAYFLLPYVSSKGIANFIGFVVVFAGCLVAGGLLSKTLATLFKWVGLSWLDRLAGAGFGFLRGTVVAIAVVLAVVAFAPTKPPKSVVRSYYAPYLIEAANVCVAMAPREVKDGFYESYAKVKGLWSDALKRRQRLPEAEI